MTSVTAHYQATFKAARETMERFEASGLLNEAIRSAVAVHLKGIEARLLNELQEQVRNRDLLIGQQQQNLEESRSMVAEAMKARDNAEARIEAKDEEIRSLDAEVARILAGEAYAKVEA